MHLIRITNNENDNKQRQWRENKTALVRLLIVFVPKHSYIFEMKGKVWDDSYYSIRYQILFPVRSQSKKIIELHIFSISIWELKIKKFVNQSLGTHVKKLIDFVGNYVLEKGARTERNSQKISIVSKTKCCTTIEGEKIKRLVWYSNNPELPCLQLSFPNWIWSYTIHSSL